MGLPPLSSNANKKEVQYQQAFVIPKKLEPQWMEAIKEAEALVGKTGDERLTYMMIKYPLVKYAELVNGRLVPNERVSLFIIFSRRFNGLKIRAVERAIRF